MATAYIQTSNLKEKEALHSAISELASNNNDTITRWIENAGGDELYVNIRHLLNEMLEGESLYLEDLTSLGASFMDIMEILEEAISKGIRIYGVKDSFSIDYNIDKRSYLAALKKFCEIYSKVISIRTKHALKKRKEAGVTLGRPVGSNDKINLLIMNREKIEKDLREGVDCAAICEMYNVSSSTLKRFIRENVKQRIHTVSKNEGFLKEVF